MNMDHNLFRYATSELSQDAFLCWLLSYAMEDGRNSNLILHDCALAMLERMCKQKDDKKIVPKAVLNIYRQFYHMDAVIHFQTITGEEYYLIIEDKTYTNEHDDQLTRYVEVLKDKKQVDEQQILGVYYKSSLQGDLSEVEKSRYSIMIRPDILELLKKYYEKMQKSEIKSDIFMAYFEKLSNDNEIAESYLTTSPTKWDYPQIESFLESIKKEPLFQSDKGKGIAWNYVPQKNGGFMALYDTGHRIVIEDGSAECSIYMQCEFYVMNQGIIPGSGWFCVKLCVDPDNTLPKEDRKKLSDDLLESIPGRDKNKYKLSGYGFDRPARLQAATYMTIGACQLYGDDKRIIDYNELKTTIHEYYNRYEEFCNHLKEEGQILA